MKSPELSDENFMEKTKNFQALSVSQKNSDVSVAGFLILHQIQDLTVLS